MSLKWYSTGKNMSELGTHPCTYLLTLLPSGTSSGALGRRDFVRPEFIAMLNDAGGPCWSYESRAGLSCRPSLEKKKTSSAPDAYWAVSIVCS